MFSKVHDFLHALRIKLSRSHSASDSICLDIPTTLAAQKVFAIPELLELILLQLPERDALLDQRVSVKWRDTIATSPKI